MKERLPILVVDDDEGIRQFIQMALDSTTFDVALAADGADGLRQAASRPPRLILLDMRMPGVDGWAFCEAYRRLAVPHAPIAVVTAARDARAYAAEVGADGFLPKPFDIADLRELVERLGGRPLPVGPAGTATPALPTPPAPKRPSPPHPRRSTRKRTR